ncbi:MAG: hypothetical protein HY049_13325 [Acidobacteria bacterium]|nr:hypothetical protein [Acidobacteriota bacterium]
MRCKSYDEWWREFYRTCSLPQHPTECWDERQYSLLKVDRYISGMVDALKDSTDPIERFDIAVEAVRLTSAHVIYEWPRRRFERRICEAVEEYLPGAPVADVRTLIGYVQDSFLGLPGSAARALRKYARKTSGLSAEDRASLVALSKRRFLEQPEDNEPRP